MAKPILSKIPVFDATVGTSIAFSCYGQVSSVSYTVYDNETGESVCTGTATSSGRTASKSFLFPGNLLSNRSEAYYIKIQALTSLSKSYSELSDPVLFYCREKPNLFFAELDSESSNSIQTSSYQFDLSYINVPTQNESLNSYQYHLYDANKNLLSESKVYYSTLSSSFIVDGLENSTTYYVRGTGETVNGYTLDTGYIELVIHYTVEINHTILDIINRYNDGVIQVNTNIVPINGKNQGEITYIRLGGGNYAADLTHGNSITYIIPYEIQAYSLEEYSIRIVVSPIIYKDLISVVHKSCSYIISTNIRKFTDHINTNENFYAILQGDGRYVVESNYITSPLDSDLIELYVLYKNGLFSLSVRNTGGGTD